MQTVFCREGDWVQLPLWVIRKTNGSRHGQKAGLTMSNSLLPKQAEGNKGAAGRFYK